jgi:hypothetical protein
VTRSRRLVLAVAALLLVLVFGTLGNLVIVGMSPRSTRCS